MLLLAVMVVLSTQSALSFAQSHQSHRFESQPSRIKTRSESLELSWKSLMEGRSTVSEIQRSHDLSFLLGAKAKYEFHPRLRLLVDTRMRLKSETTQSLFERKDNQNGVYLYQAMMSWAPFRFARLDLGAVNMGFLEAPLLVTDRAFLGGRETLGWGGEQFRVRLHFLQAVPTSTSFSSENAEIEKTPWFMSETLKLRIQPHRRFRVKGHATHFQYKDLPGAVALESRIYGNTVPPTNGKYGQFAYGFSGFEAGGAVSLDWSSWFQTSAGLSFLENSEAPEKLNKGQIIFAEMDWRVGSDLHLIPRFESFINQSDSAPAYYNSEIYGHNDRIGERVDLGLWWKRQGWRLKASYVNSRSIHKDPLEPSQELYWITLETSYAEI